LTLSRKNSLSIQRLGSEDWLILALETLSKQGQSKLTIDRLVADLGVTKGSFYWHFKNRADFLEKLIEQWAKEFTVKVVEQAMADKNDAAGRLFRLMEVITLYNVSRYDIAVRAWAAQDDKVAKIVKRVDKTRMKDVQSLFEELGFKGDELIIRSRAFLYWGSFGSSFSVPQPKKDKLRILKQCHTFFIRP
jgi:AcrR family transcriptional regulator